MLRSAAPLVLLLLAAGPAAALTPDDLWQAWQDRAAGFGATLGAEVERGADGTLTLRGLSLAVGDEAPEPLGRIARWEIVLSPAEDDAVAIGLPLESRLDIPPQASTGFPAMLYEQDGLTITARDGDGGIDYEVAARALRWATRPGDEPAALDLAMEMTGLSARLPDRFGAGGATQVDLSLAADGLAYVLATGDEAMAMSSSQSARVEDIALDLALTIPPGLDPATWEDDDGAAFLAALQAGLAMRLDGRLGASTSSAAMAGLYDYLTTGSGGTMTASLDADGLLLAGEGGGSTISGSLPVLSVPAFDASIGPYEAEFRVPFGAEPGDFRYRVALSEVTLGDAVWDAVDPGRHLARGTGRMVVDVGGRATLDLAAMQAAEAGAAAGGAPYVPSIESLEVRELDLAVGGAAMAATGAFTFDATMTPVGTGAVTLTGANGVLDALVAMGVVPADQAQGARMGLAMFFDPGEGEDVLTTEVEARADGRVLVNGQPMR